MALYTPFMPPTNEEHDRILKLVRDIRTFDRNIRDDSWKSHGYFLIKLGEMIPDYFALPISSPHGRLWGSMTDEELREAMSWTLLPEEHEALMKERSDRFQEHRR
jgi:hypothetical protein